MTLTSFIEAITLLASLWVIVPFLLFALLAEMGQSTKWATSHFIIAAIGIVLMVGNVQYIFAYGAAYLLIGIFWSFYRYSRWIGKNIQQDSKNMSKEYVERCYSPKNNADLLACWVIVWPVSIITEMTGDVIHTIKYMITYPFNVVYQKIFDSAINKAKFKPEVEDVNCR